MTQTYMFYEEIARGLTDELLIDAYAVAYHATIVEGKILEDSYELEAYKTELMLRLNEE